MLGLNLAWVNQMDRERSTEEDLRRRQLRAQLDGGKRTVEITSEAARVVADRRRAGLRVGTTAR